MVQTACAATGHCTDCIAPPHRRHRHRHRRRVTFTAATTTRSAPALVQANCNLAHVEKDEVLALVRHKGTEVAADKTVPRGAVLLIKERLDALGDILLHRITSVHEFLCHTEGVRLRSAKGARAWG